jgi:hypothetical protein
MGSGRDGANPGSAYWEYRCDRTFVGLNSAVSVVSGVAKGTIWERSVFSAHTAAPVALGTALAF